MLDESSAYAPQDLFRVLRTACLVVRTGRGLEPREQTSGRAQMLHGARGPEQRQYDGPLDVVERLTCGRIVGPPAGVTVGEGDRPPGGEPTDCIDERVAIGCTIGFELDSVDLAGLGCDVVGQLGQCDLIARSPESSERECQVGVSTPVEHTVRGSARGLAGIQAVENGKQAGGGFGDLEAIAEQLEKILA